jgi:hypothetical protein
MFDELATLDVLAKPHRFNAVCPSRLKDGPKSLNFFAQKKK